MTTETKVVKTRAPKKLTYQRVLDATSGLTMSEKAELITVLKKDITQQVEKAKAALEQASAVASTV